MGLDLGGLTSITKIFDAGNLVKQAVNSVLPKNMAVVGDAAGAIFDLKTGNLFGAAQLAMDGIKDLPQATKSQQQQAQQGAGGTARGEPVPTKPGLEPSPPPAAAKPLDLGKLEELFNQILAMFGKKPESPPASTETKSTEKTAWGMASIGTTNPAHDAVAENSASKSTTTTTTTTRETSGWRGSPTTVTDAASSTYRAAKESSGWRGEPRTPPPPATTQSTSAASTTAAASAPAAPTKPAPAAPAAAPATPASTSAADTGQTISSMSQLNSMSDTAVRDAVIHGRISPELAKDQTAMMAIQQRMNAISEMNNLMTNMMKALHDMQMAVVQNIRI